MRAYYTHGGRRFGPVDGPGLGRAAAGGGLCSTDFVLMESGRWLRASEVEGLHAPGPAADSTLTRLREQLGPLGKRVGVACGVARREAVRSARELGGLARRLGSLAKMTGQHYALRRQCGAARRAFAEALYARSLGDPTVRDAIAAASLPPAPGSRDRRSHERAALLDRLAESVPAPPAEVGTEFAAWREAQRRLVELDRMQADARGRLLPAGGRDRARVWIGLGVLLLAVVGGVWAVTPVNDRGKDVGHSLAAVDGGSRTSLPAAPMESSKTATPASAGTARGPAAEDRKSPLPQPEPERTEPKAALPVPKLDGKGAPPPQAKFKNGDVFGRDCEIHYVWHLPGRSKVFILAEADRGNETEVFGTLWDLKQNRAVWSPPPFFARPQQNEPLLGAVLAAGLGVSPDGDRVAYLNGADGKLHLFDLTAQTGLAVEAHRETPGWGSLFGGSNRARFSGDGREVVTWSSGDGMTRVWDAKSGKLVHGPLELSGREQWELLAYDRAAGTLLVSGSDVTKDGGRPTVRRFRVPSGEALSAAPVQHVSPLRSADEFVALTGRGLVLIDKAAKEVRTFCPLPEKDHPLSWAVSPDATKVAALRDDRLTVWEVATGKRVGEVAGARGVLCDGTGYQAGLSFDLRSLGGNWTCFSADWGRVAVGTLDDKKQTQPQMIAYVYDVATGEKTHQLRMVGEKGAGDPFGLSDSRLLPFSPGDPVLISRKFAASNKEYTTYRVWRADAVTEKP